MADLDEVRERWAKGVQWLAEREKAPASGAACHDWHPFWFWYTANLRASDVRVTKAHEAVVADRYDEWVRAMRLFEGIDRQLTALEAATAATAGV